MEENVMQQPEEPTPSYVLASILKTRIKDVYAGDVKKALLSDDPRSDALEELIAVGEMEKQFDFYRRLLGKT